MTSHQLDCEFKNALVSRELQDSLHMLLSKNKIASSLYGSYCQVTGELYNQDKTVYILMVITLYVEPQYTEETKLY